MQNSDQMLSAFMERTELVFALPLPQILRSLLYCYQYLIGVDLCHKYSTIFKNKREKAQLISEELYAAIKAMTQKQRFDMYYLITDSIFKLVNGNIQFNCRNHNDYIQNGFVKTSKNRSWRERQIIYNSFNHVVFVVDKKHNKKMTINLSEFLYRKSKNQNYFALALQACDKRVDRNLRTIYLGFQDSNIFEHMLQKIKQSVHFRQWEYVKAMYVSDPLTKNSINSMRRQSFCNNAVISQNNQLEEQFFTCQNLQTFDDKQNFVQNIKKNHQQQNSNCKILKQRNFNNLNNISIKPNSKINKVEQTKLLALPIVQNFVKQKQIQRQKCLSHQWRRDEQKGGLQYLNFQKIAAQKGVIKHIIGQMGRNLFSGKSILNLSLPVQIFSAESHLQRLLHSLRMAPTFFGKYDDSDFNTQDSQKFQKILAQSAAFGISTSLLYLNQQKSFNPILGETCQMLIEGCPAYAEQISHHPPISSFLFVGKSYRIYGQLEAKVELGLNSGKGSNSGQITIQFNSGLKIDNYFAAGEVTGLSYGKRKFSLIGKSHHFIQNKQLYLQVDFQQNKKNNIKKNEDQFCGKYYEIPTEQIKQFKRNKKFKNGKKHHFLKQQNRLYGNWNKSIQFQQSNIIDLQSAQVSEMKRDSSLLPSDSFWRQDIRYKKQNNLRQAQNMKQRLQTEQRRDQKLRNHRQK